MTLYEKALKIAVEAHKNQVRKHDKSPYISHPIMVGRILEQAGFSEEVVAAGLIHDVLEDTDVNEAFLREQLGDEVVDIVTAVSEDQTVDWRSIEGGWEKVKQMYIETVAASNEKVWAVSVADKIHNAESLINYHHLVGNSAWQVFNRGKEKKIWFEKSLFKALKEKWTHPLLDTYGLLITKLESLEA